MIGKVDLRLAVLWIILAVTLVYFINGDDGVMLSPGEDAGIYFWIIVSGLSLGLLLVSALIVKSSIKRKQEEIEEFKKQKKKRKR